MFAPSFFEHLEDRLNLAVYDTNQEYRMADSPIISRLKDKLGKAAGVAQRVATGIETEADSLIAQEDAFRAKTTNAFAPHKAILTEASTELKAIEDALNLMSNGGPALDPLHDAGSTVPASNVGPDGKPYPTYP
jgi:hypothetical protein